MELWTILRCWCIVYVLAVIIHSSAAHGPFMRKQILTGGEINPSGGFQRRKYLEPHHRSDRRKSAVHQPPRHLSKDVVEEDCDQLPEDELSQLLGTAFNPRYMRIRAPEVKQLDPNSKKRGAEEDELLFAVDETYAQEISAQPAWEWNLAANDLEDSEEYHRERRSPTEDGNQQREEGVAPGVREQRSSSGLVGVGSGDDRPWKCDMKIKWTDLGEDYFPRFLRTAECAMTRCFYGQYTCKPRSFTVLLLRRRRGRCARMGGGVRSQAKNSTTTSTTTRTTTEYLPEDLRELWVWEERALNFCCECALKSGPPRY